MYGCNRFSMAQHMVLEPFFNIGLAINGHVWIGFASIGNFFHCVVDFINDTTRYKPKYAFCKIGILL